MLLSRPRKDNKQASGCGRFTALCHTSAFSFSRAQRKSSVGGWMCSESVLSFQFMFDSLPFTMWSICTHQRGTEVSCEESEIKHLWWDSNPGVHSCNSDVRVVVNIVLSMGHTLETDAHTKRVWRWAAWEHQQAKHGVDCWPSRDKREIYHEGLCLFRVTTISVIPDFLLSFAMRFTHFSFLLNHLDIYWMDYCKIWYTHSWSPENIFV